MNAHSSWPQRRKRVFEIIEIGAPEDYVSRLYDFFNSMSIVVNLTVSVMYTFQTTREKYGTVLLTVEAVTVAFFAVDYLLRLWTAKFLRPKLSEGLALRRYIFSFNGIVDLLSFLPYYLPVFFPAGAVAFRMFRVVRIFRLFRINAYYDSLNIITEVITSKRQQLFSSVFIISVLMLAASLCMYSLEHEAQPDVFTNAFSGIWWAVSTLLTVGYGDIYPITYTGKIFSIIITFLGVGMVAIPTGIISAGFVDQYSRIKRLKYILSQLGMAGEKGSKDILDLCAILLEEGGSASQIPVSTLCTRLPGPPKTIEQRARRAVERCLSHMASLGLEDYNNEVFLRYATRLFPFQEVRAEMAFQQGKGPRGKASLKKFLDGLVLLLEED